MRERVGHLKHWLKLQDTSERVEGPHLLTYEDRKMADAVPSHPDFHSLMNAGLELLEAAHMCTRRGAFHCLNKSECDRLIQIFGNKPDFQDKRRQKLDQNSWEAKKLKQLHKLANELGVKIISPE